MTGAKGTNKLRRLQDQEIKIRDQIEGLKSKIQLEDLSREQIEGIREQIEEHEQLLSKILLDKVQCWVLYVN